MAGGRPKWNVATPRAYGQDGDKTFWVNVGSAWENDSGKGKHDVTITLDSLPLPDKDGNVRLFLFPKEDSGDRGSGGERRRGGGRRGAIDDDIPF